MVYTRILGIGLALGLTLAGTQAGLAHGKGHDKSDDQTVDATLVQEFSSADSVELFKHHNRLFAFVESSDGLDLYGANRKGDAWGKLDSDATPVADLLDEAMDVTAFAVFKNYLYAAVVDVNGQPAVWRIKLNGRPAEWKQSSEISFGDETNTAIVDFARIPGTQLVAITTNTAGNGLFATTDGKTWEQVGDYGLGQGVTDALAANAIWVVDEAVNLATTSGALYQANFSDLTTWTLVTTFSDGAVTAMRGRFVATVDAGGVVRLYESDSTNIFTQVGESDLGEDNNEVITRIVNLTQRPEVVVTNSTDGVGYYKFDNDTATWEALTDNGFGDANNTAVNDFIWYRGDAYASTVNSVDGPQVYRLK